MVKISIKTKLISSYIKSYLKNLIYYPILKYYKKKNKINLKNFSFSQFKERILHFIISVEDINTPGFKFSPSSSISDLYSTTYAISLLGIIKEIKSISTKKIIELKDYFLKFQCEDGLFRDPLLKTNLAEEGHHWGWFHLTPHTLVALDYLNLKPKYDFNGLLKRFKKESVSSWLKNLDWTYNYLISSNEVLNVGVMLQYSRDFFKNQRSSELVSELKEWLVNNYFNYNKLLYSASEKQSKFNISKTTKTIYHLAPIFIYDDDVEKLPIDKILSYTLRTQNTLGGYGPSILTDACEDIDSIYLLTQLSHSNLSFFHSIKQSIIMFLKYIWINQNRDGGFVFKRMKPFQYGDQPILSSTINESNLFATWFRTLSIAFATYYLDISNDWIFSKVPGYQYNNYLKIYH